MSANRGTRGTETNQVERGVKRRCASCDAPFYDMLRYPIRCPKCGAEFDATVGKKLASVPRAPRASKAQIGRPATATAASTVPELEQEPPLNKEEVEDEDDRDEDLVDGEEDAGDEEHEDGAEDDDDDR